MLEQRIRYVLKHKPTGLYWSNKADRTKKLFDAWRFYDEEQCLIWMQVSMYAPPDPENYKPVRVQQIMREDINHANTESGTEESEA